MSEFIKALEELSSQADKICINLNGRIERESSPFAVGGESVLYKGTLDPDKEKIVIKSVRFSTQDRKAIKRIIREVHVWSKLKHDNIIRLLGITTEFDHTMAIVMHWMERGNAYKYVQDRAVDPRPLVLGIAKGLEYLHKHRPGPIFHGDLKGDNVLVADDGHALLSDFGLSVLVDTSLPLSVSSPCGGTCRYMAPELLNDCSRISAECDLWAFGMTALELFTRTRPFDGIRTYPALVKRINRRPPDRPTEEATCGRMSEEWWRLFSECWQYQPSSRPQISTVVSKIENLV
ncbi:hypothetical protein ID866_10300 [Astraeus odoratus]|nr:hypothetical protein ID866_10300 [Astraeus odoratus]